MPLVNNTDHNKNLFLYCHIYQGDIPFRCIAIVSLITDGGALEKVETPALFRLISLQNADGSWKPSTELASILGTSDDFKEGCPDGVTCMI